MWRLLATCLVAAVYAPSALASEAFSDVNVRNATLAVNAKGEALVSYVREDGRPRHVLIWGAINALPPSADVPQAHFKLDYAGGWGKYRKGTYWKTFKNTCRPYDGPALADFVTACKARDGSYWALQTWQRSLPLLGFKPWLPRQSAYELHLSHWSGALAQFTVGQHWSYGGSAVGLFGRLTYDGQAVHGISANPRGNPNDRYGRNVYIDTFNSQYGPGWAREAGILAHTPNGTFCHSFVPQKPFPGYPDGNTRPAAPGDRYRITVMGPGVTPVIVWEDAGLTSSWTGSADQQATQAKARELWDEMMSADKQCAPEKS